VGLRPAGTGTRPGERAAAAAARRVGRAIAAPVRTARNRAPIFSETGEHAGRRITHWKVDHPEWRSVRPCRVRPRHITCWRGPA
jgi:hypothetical protein